MSAAIAVAHCLVDYKLSESTSIGQKYKVEGFKKHKAVGKPLEQVEGKQGGMATIPKVRDGSTNQNVQQASKPVGCFICQGPHRAKDCPRKEKLSALHNTKEEDSDSDDSSPQLNPLQVVTALHTPMFFYQLMYVFVHLNGISVKAMIDMSVTYSCLASSVATKLNMRVEPHASETIPLNGMNQQVDGFIHVTSGGARDWTRTLYLLYQTLVCPSIITVSTYRIQKKYKIKLPP